MRIVSGRWAGRDLLSPGGRVRPTAEVVRSAWLDRLNDVLDGARVLDLFAGTGALGLEALSRGAQQCDFVENGPGALHALKANVARFRLKGRTRVFRRDALAFADRLEADAYDLCLADPPYTSSLARRLAETWLERPFAAVLAVETDAAERLPRARRGVSAERLVVDDTAVTIFRLA
ncbi:MAG: RsmD family RNA methyltransferase [Longimicrobiales bacterium]